MADPTFVDGILVGLLIAMAYRDFRAVWLEHRKEKQHG